MTFNAFDWSLKISFKAPFNSYKIVSELSYLQLLYQYVCLCMAWLYVPCVLNNDKFFFCVCLESVDNYHMFYQEWIRSIWNLLKIPNISFYDTSAININNVLCNQFRKKLTMLYFQWSLLNQTWVFSSLTTTTRWNRIWYFWPSSLAKGLWSAQLLVHEKRCGSKTLG